MKINTSDKLIAWLTLLSGLSISAVAVWYSVAGLVSIFAAAAVPIMIMGVALEVSKLVATIWLKFNWSIAPRLIKTYLIIAITILMMITSMGIFGFLSKAHLDQAVPTGDVADKVAFLDEKISTQKENINAARKALKQMDESVDQVMARSSDEKGADKAAALRRGQQRERAQLQGDISKAQSEIAKLNEERAPIAKELRKVEAEVGPIKYIAALLYGDNPDQNILEKAVRWVIIIIVAVFDPLAVILLLASQYSFMWFRGVREENDGLLHKTVEHTETPVEEPVKWAGFDIQKPHYDEEELEIYPDEGPDPEVDIDEVNAMLAEVEKDEPTLESVGIDNQIEFADVPKEPEIKFSELAYLNSEKSFWAKPEGWVEVAPLVAPAYDDDHDEDDTEEIKEAKRNWKAENPNSSLKLQRKLLEEGKIDRLPWEDYLKPQADFAVEEAKKWAEENPQTAEAQEAEQWANEHDLERPGDYVTPPTYMENVDGHQVKKTVEGYQQNAEQGKDTIWQRIKKF